MDKTILAIIALVAITVGGFFILFKGQDNSPNKQGTDSQLETTSSVESSPSDTIAPIVEDVTELKIEDQVIGTGDLATQGKKITVNYRGTLTNGKEFDNSYDRGAPFAFTLGAGEVIEGWDKGFEGMKVGGKRKLTIPSSMGYGERGAGASIPPNSTLVFEVELLKVE